MNLRKKMRRGSLAALIALALTSSALAMPTGGTVVEGNIGIDGGTFSNPANNAVISTTTDGLIRWDPFNIGEGERLRFIIPEHKTLVNQVTGAQASEILGSMTQVGFSGDPYFPYAGNSSGSMVLVNPNGIHIGPNAYISMADLTLSALGIDKMSDAERILKQTGEGLVSIDGGARFSGHELNIFGGKVTVADGVQFDLGNSITSQWDTQLQIRAANSITWGLQDDTEKVVYTPGNDVSIGAIRANLSGSGQNDVEINGAKVSVTGAYFAGADNLETTIYAASQFSANEGGSDRNAHTYVGETTPENVLSVDGIEVHGAQLSLGGGVVNLKKINSSASEVGIDAVSKITSKGDGVRVETLAAPDRTVNISDSQFGGANKVGIYGGKVTVAGNDVSFIAGANPEDFEVVAGNVRHDESRYTMGVGNDIVFRGVVGGGFGTGDSALSLLGNTVNLDAAKIVGVGNVHIAATTGIKVDGDVATVTSTAGNKLAANGLLLDATNDTLIAGGTVTLSHAQVNTNSHRLLIATGTVKEQNGDALSVTTQPNQSVTINGTSTFTTREVEITGGTVTVDKDVSFTSSIPSGGGDFGIVAGNQVNDDAAQRYTTQTSAGNNIVFRGKIEKYGKTSDDPVLFIGNKVTLDGASLTNNGDVRLAAANKVDSNGSNVAIEVAKGNELGLWRTTLSAGQVNLAGGTIGVWKNSAVTSGAEVGVNPSGVVSRTDGSAGSVLRDASSTVTPSTAFTEASAVPEQPPVPQPVPDEPQPEPKPSLAEKDIENIETGAQVVKNILVNNATTATRTAALMQTIEKMNDDNAASQRQTAGVMMGIFNEIATSDALTENEKIALHRTAFESYKLM